MIKLLKYLTETCSSSAIPFLGLISKLLAHKTQTRTLSGTLLCVGAEYSLSLIIIGNFETQLQKLVKCQKYAKNQTCPRTLHLTTIQTRQKQTV